MSELKLKNPIMINGEEVDSLRYNLSELTEENLLHAMAVCHFGKDSFSGLLENDYSFQMWLMFVSIMKEHNEIDEMDLKRISGKDGLELIKECGELLANHPSEQTVELEGIEYSIDDEKLTVDMYMEADSESRRYANSIQKPSIKTASSDMAYHLFIGYHLINASNDNISMEQLRNMKGGNLIKIMRVGRNFILGALAEDYVNDSLPESSEKSSEDIREFTTAE